MSSSEERCRAARFKFFQDRKRWTTARASIRVIVGSYLGLAPSAISFAYSQHGKPEIAHPLSSGGLQFNVSHSEQFCALALTQLGPIGVDVERVRELPEALDIARESFSDDEYQLLLTEAPAQRRRSFIRLWTEKEAYLKAIGCGLGQIAEA